MDQIIITIETQLSTHNCSQEIGYHQHHRIFSYVFSNSIPALPEGLSPFSLLRSNFPIFEG